jgi:ABC-type branched-subunit amino acid transport system ATPase component
VPSSTAVLIVEHSVRSLVPHVEWLVALDEGVAIASGPPQQVVADERVIVSYLGAGWSRSGARGGADAVSP